MNNSLFPAYSLIKSSITTNTTFQSSSLIKPSSSSDLKDSDSPDHDITSKVSEQGWLDNKSYTSHATQKLDEIKAELHDAERIESASPCDKDEPETKPKKQKRRTDERDSKKHKKKKRHKESRDKSGIVNDSSDNLITQSPKHETVFTGKGKLFVDEFRDMRPEDAFRVDRAGDHNNWGYESLYKMHVCRYRRLFNWSLCSNFRDRVCLAKKSHKKQKTDGRYYCKDSINLSQSGTFGEKVKPTENPLLDVTGDSYIGLSEKAALPYRELGNIQSLGIYDAATRLYLEGKAPIAPDEPDIVERGSFQTRTAEFNGKLRENPRDVDLWLEFVKFQDEFVCDLSAVSSGSQQSNRSDIQKTEKKLSILDRAIESNARAVKLKVEKIKLSALVKESEQVAREWENLLFVHSGNGDVWKSYLLFVQSQLGAFTVSRVVEAYQRCLETVTAILDGSVQSVDVSQDLSHDRLDIFARYCHFLRQTDHSEKSVASYQALIEFNLYTPPVVMGLSLEERCVVFDSLWDSNVAVFGETGARGWTYWHGQRSPSSDFTRTDENVEEREKEILSDGSSRWDAWSKLETLRSQRHLLRWRPDISRNESEEDCEDTDRLVLVDDVTPVLFIVDEARHFDLVLMFLRFLGVSVSQFLGRTNRECLYEIDERFRVDLLSDLDIGICGADDGGKYTELKRELIRNVFKQALSRFNGKKRVVLIGSLFEFEYDVIKIESWDKGKVKELRRRTKGLMKEADNRNCVLLWVVYARLEMRLGFRTEAGKVVKTLILSQPKSWFSSTDAADTHERMKLFCFYAKLLLNISENTLTMTGGVLRDVVRKTEVLSVLVSIANNNALSETPAQGLSSVEILRTRQRFQKQLNDIFTVPLTDYDEETRCETVVELVDCVALFEYVVSNIHDAVAIYTSVISDQLQTWNHQQDQTSTRESPEILASLAKESLLTSQINLICHHLNQHPTPLMKLRERLAIALSHFPQNVYFLRVFIDVELKSFIAGRLRRYFDAAVRRCDSLIPVLYCLHAEMSRWNVQRHPATAVSETTDTGIVHRIRSLFDRTLASDACRHSVLLWRLYVQFEIQTGDTQRATGIFYRSLQQCPWAKVLYKEAVCLFPEKIEEITDLMLDKELRIHAPIEEVDILLEEMGQLSASPPQVVQ